MYSSYRSRITLGQRCNEHAYVHASPTFLARVIESYGVTLETPLRGTHFRYKDKSVDKIALSNIVISVTYLEELSPLRI